MKYRGRRQKWRNYPDFFKAFNLIGRECGPNMISPRPNALVRGGINGGNERLGQIGHTGHGAMWGLKRITLAIKVYSYFGIGSRYLEIHKFKSKDGGFPN